MKTVLTYALIAIVALAVATWSAGVLSDSISSAVKSVSTVLSK